MFCKTQGLLQDLLKEIIQSSLKIEQAKVELCNQTQFDPLQYFTYLTNATGILGIKQVPDPVIQWYDEDNDGYLSYEDFLHLVSPIMDNSLRIGLRLKKQNARVNFELTDLFFKNLLNLEHRHLLRLDSLLVQIRKQPDFSEYSCYRLIDYKNIGFIDYDCLLKFINYYHTPLNDEIMLGVIRFINRVTKCEPSKKITLPMFLRIFNKQVCADLTLYAQPKEEFNTPIKVMKYLGSNYNSAAYNTTADSKNRKSSLKKDRYRSSSSKQKKSISFMF